MNDDIQRAKRSTDYRAEDIQSPRHPRNLRAVRWIALALITVMVLCFAALASAETLAIICTKPAATNSTPSNCLQWKYDIPLDADQIRAGTSWSDFVLKQFGTLAPATTLDTCTTVGVVRGALIGSQSDTCNAWAITRADAFPLTPRLAIGWTQEPGRMDGSPLTNLAGFRVIYGIDPTSLTTIIDIPDANARSYVVPNLAYGANYFVAVKSYDSDKIESDKSNTIQRTTAPKPGAPKAKPVAPVAK